MIAAQACRSSNVPGQHRGQHRTAYPRLVRTIPTRALWLNQADSAWRAEVEWPREESNLRTRIRSPSLYPLSYGAPLARGGGRDLNPRPPGPQPGALPTELPPPRVTKDSFGLRLLVGLRGGRALGRASSRGRTARLRPPRLLPGRLDSMRARGLEPPRAFAHRVLSPARMPVPPRPLAGSRIEPPGY